MANKPAANERRPDEKLSGGDKFLGAMCYLSILILVPALSKRRHEAFVRDSLNQGLVLLALATVCGAIGMVPHCGELGTTLVLLVDALSLVGLVQALRGIYQPLPGVANITKNFHPFD